MTREDAYEKGYADAKKQFERPKGKWVLIDKELSRYQCPKCGEIIRLYKKNEISYLDRDETINDYPFSHCGLDMRGGEGMNYKNFNLGDWIGHISGAIEDERELDGNEMRYLIEFLSTLEQKPCEDAVSREAVLKVVNNPFIRRDKVIEELPPVAPKQRWIPVSERLPTIADVYRVTRYYSNNVMNPNYIVDACYFDGSNTWYNDNRINHERAYADNVIAWQENPEPYKVESNKTEQGIRDTSDVLTVSFDSGLKDESALCVTRKYKGKIIILKMELGEQADILYRLLTEQMAKAEIKTESEEV